jgi:hypothetical protein
VKRRTLTRFRAIARIKVFAFSSVAKGFPMNRFTWLAVCSTLLLACSSARAAEISGEYLEARSCDVYTGPCFANSQAGLAGREALMAWKVDDGKWNGVRLCGLGVAVVLNAESTLGEDGVFPMTAGQIKSVILVDQKASKEQQAALIDFARKSAKGVIGTVQTVKSVPLSLSNDHLAGKGVFKAGDLAAIETRALQNSDRCCSNESCYYQPLSKVENSSPAYAKTLKYTGDSLDSQWELHNIRSAMLATFER